MVVSNLHANCSVFIVKITFMYALQVFGKMDRTPVLILPDQSQTDYLILDHRWTGPIRHCSYLIH